VDACCSGQDCPPEEHRQHHSLLEKVHGAYQYTLHEVWYDMASWFLAGLILAGVISALVPTQLMSEYLGGGLTSMLVMLAVGIPLYICATASTPIAAALILKGVSPGAALVFLLAGPATNVTSLTVLFGILGKRATAIYLGMIALGAVGFGLLLDSVYAAFGWSALAMVGQAGEILPGWAKWTGAAILLVVSVKPVYQGARARLGNLRKHLQGAQTKGNTMDRSTGISACAGPT
jgi:hypothetical protein